VPTKKQIITIGVLCVIALGLGYWSSMPEKGSGQRAEVLAPTVVTNIAAATPQSIPNITLPYSMNPVIERAVRLETQKPIGELTELDFEKVKVLDFSDGGLTEVPRELEKFPQLQYLSFHNNKLTDAKGLAKFTNLRHLNLYSNQLTDVQGLENLTNLELLVLQQNRYLRKTQIQQLQKALPNCKIQWP